jgi:hypothetical protein
VFTFFANYSSYLFSRYAPLTLPKKVRAMFKTASSIIHSIVFVAHEIYKTFVSSYHLAEKKIPSIHGYAMGLKLEQYIFDAFSYSPSTALFEVQLLSRLCSYNILDVMLCLFVMILRNSSVYISENSGFAGGGICACKECEWRVL